METLQRKVSFLLFGIIVCFGMMFAHPFTNNVFAEESTTTAESADDVISDKVTGQTAETAGSEENAESEEAAELTGQETSQTAATAGSTGQEAEVTDKASDESESKTTILGTAEINKDTVSESQKDEESEETPAAENEPTVLNGVDYAKVYNYVYYSSHNPDLTKDGEALLQYFVNTGMSKGDQASENFDVKSYRLQYPDLRSTFGSNLASYYMHYLTYGAGEGRSATGTTEMVGYQTAYNGFDYADVYDFNYYINKYGDLENAFGIYGDASALKHFVTLGMKEKRQAKESFDVNSYQLAYGDLRRAFGSNMPAYYKHYVTNGKKEGRISTGVTEIQGAVTSLKGIDYSKVYDYHYYIKNHSDLKDRFGNDDTAVLKYFVNTGMSKGDQASENFDVTSYRLQNPDLRNAFGSNLHSYYMHYINYGAGEGRKGTGTTEMVGYQTVYNGFDYADVYDFNYYINKYSDLKNAFGIFGDAAALKHFVIYGMAEKRQAKSDFNVNYYYKNYADLRTAYKNNFPSYYRHYVIYGKEEGRNASSGLTVNPVSGGYEIMGASSTDVDQMERFYEKSKKVYPVFYQDTDAPTIRDMAAIYMDEAAKEGVKAEVAFAQMLLETGWLQYGGDVKIEQFNFAGVGATGNGEQGNNFGKVRLGVRAQIQHLKAYATDADLNQACVDPRRENVASTYGLGCAPTVEELSGKWSVSASYGKNIRGMINRLLAA